MTPLKLHVLRPDEKVEGSIQLRNELGNDKVKWLYCNKQRTEAGSEWSINANSAEVNGAPLLRMLTDVISQDYILQRNLASSNNSQTVLSRTVWIRTLFFVNALESSEFSLCGEAILESTYDRQTPFYVQDTRY